MKFLSLSQLFQQVSPRVRTVVKLVVAQIVRNSTMQTQRNSRYRKESRAHLMNRRNLSSTSSNHQQLQSTRSLTTKTVRHHKAPPPKLQTTTTTSDQTSTSQPLISQTNVPNNRVWMKVSPRRTQKSQQIRQLCLHRRNHSKILNCATQTTDTTSK